MKEKLKEQNKASYFQEALTIVKRLLQQARKDKNKRYSLHEPEVICISHGKAHKKYEYGRKVSIAITHKKGFALSAKSHSGHPYDGHTLNEINLR